MKKIRSRAVLAAASVVAVCVSTVAPTAALAASLISPGGDPVLNAVTDPPLAAAAPDPYGSETSTGDSSLPTGAVPSSLPDPASPALAGLASSTGGAATVAGLPGPTTGTTSPASTGDASTVTGTATDPTPSGEGEGEGDDTPTPTTSVTPTTAPNEPTCTTTSSNLPTKDAAWNLPPDGQTVAASTAFTTDTNLGLSSKYGRWTVVVSGWAVGSDAAQPPTVMLWPDANDATSAGGGEVDLGRLTDPISVGIFYGAGGTGTNFTSTTAKKGTHTLSVEWTAQGINWYVDDGTAVKQVLTNACPLPPRPMHLRVVPNGGSVTIDSATFRVFGNSSYTPPATPPPTTPPPTTTPTVAPTPTLTLTPIPSTSRTPRPSRTPKTTPTATSAAKTSTATSPAADSGVEIATPPSSTVAGSGSAS